MPHLHSFTSLHQLSTPTLGVSVLVCTVIAYTLAKMFGFGRKNEFPVEGRVSPVIQSLPRELDTDLFLQTVVITGGSDGMGRAVALQLAAKGAHVVVVARTVSKLERVVDEMKVRVCIPLATVSTSLTHFPGQRWQCEQAALLLHQRRPH